MSRLYRANQFAGVAGGTTGLVLPGSVAGGPPNTGRTPDQNFRDRPYNGVEWNLDSFQVDFSTSNLVGAIETVTANVIASGVVVANVDLLQTKLDATTVYFSGTATPAQNLIIRYTDSLSFFIAVTTSFSVAGAFAFTTALSIFGELTPSTP